MEIDPLGLILQAIKQKILIKRMISIKLVKQ